MNITAEPMATPSRKDIIDEDVRDLARHLVLDHLRAHRRRPSAAVRLAGMFRWP